MQDHRNEGVPAGPPAHDSLEHRAQRTVLLEIVLCPPDQPDRVDELIDRLDLPDHSIEPAVAALELAGLAERQEEVVRASLSARYFEHLWRIRP